MVIYDLAFGPKNRQIFASPVECKTVDVFWVNLEICSEGEIWLTSRTVFRVCFKTPLLYFLKLR